MALAGGRLGPTGGATRALIASVRIVRPHDCASALATVILGAQLAAIPYRSTTLALAGATVFMLVGAGNILNDYFDVEIDKVNRPRRPLPSGQISRNTALKLFITLSALSLVSSVLVGYRSAIIAVVVGVLSYLYSSKLKRTVILGNIVISFLGALTVIYGGVVVGYSWPSLVPAVTIFQFMLWREMVKTVDDHEGDSLHGAQTLSTVVGKPRAIKFSGTLALLVIVTSIVSQVMTPRLAGNPFIMFLIMTIFVGCNAILLLKLTDRSIGAVLKITKGVFGVWLIAMFLG